MYMDLVNIEKDLELIKTRGGGASLLDDDVEECRRHIELIIECSHDIKRSSDVEVRSVFKRIGETL